ncbi:MAG: energy transducer TonB, partial [Bryobacteraceae bacterium]
GVAGREVCGLLIGRMLRGKATVEVIGYEQLLGSADLTGEERILLRDRVAAQKSSPDEAFVGFFRSRIGEGNGLSAEDVSLFRECFPDPLQVFLLVRPQSGGQHPSAGFFFWDGKLIFTDFSFVEFPFDALALAEESSTSMVAAAAQTAPTAPMVAPPTLVASATQMPTAPVYTPPPPVEAEPTPAATKVPEPPAAAPATPPVTPRVTPPITAPFRPLENPPRPARMRRIDGERDDDDARERRRRKRIGWVWIPIYGVLMFLLGAVADRMAGPVIFPQLGQSSDVVVATQSPRSAAPAAATPAPATQTPAASVPSAPAPATQAPPPAASASEAEKQPIEATIPKETGHNGNTKISARSVSVMASGPSPTAISDPQPKIPAAFNGQLSGDMAVDVRVNIDRRGYVYSARAISQKGSSAGSLTDAALLTNAAVKAARAWKFRPAHRRGLPVPSEVTIRFRFSPAQSEE